MSLERIIDNFCDRPGMFVGTITGLDSFVYGVWVGATGSTRGEELHEAWAEIKGKPVTSTFYRALTDEGYSLEGAAALMSKVLKRALEKREERK
jgi:hypothetical protein